MWRTVGVLALVSTCSLPRPAAADDTASKRWVAVRLTGPGWTPAFADSVLTDISAEVRRHGVEVDRAEQPRPVPPIATLEIEASQPSAMHISLDIVDASASGKRPARELQLDSVPVDGHSLAIAVAADELLTSSWIRWASPPVPDTATTAAAAPAAPAPVKSDEAAAPRVAPVPTARTPRRHELGVLVASNRLMAGPSTFGLDLALRRWLLPRWGVELSAGVRGQTAQDAPHGRILGRAIPLSFRLVASAVPFGARARAGVAGTFTTVPLLYRGEPSAGATAVSQTAIALYLAGDVWADLALGRFRLRASAGVGIPVRKVTADDTGVGVGSTPGLDWHGQLGLVLEL